MYFIFSLVVVILVSALVDFWRYIKKLEKEICDLEKLLDITIKANNLHHEAAKNLNDKIQLLERKAATDSNK